MNRHDELIANLSRDLEPVAPAPNIDALGAAWFLASAVFVVAVTHLLAPARPGAFAQLAAEPRFLLETLLGVAAIAWAGLAAFRAAIPGALSHSFTTIGIVLMSLWLAQYLFGLVSPALEPSALGKRGHCYIETMLYAVPPILAAQFLVRRLFPLHFVRTSMSLGLVAGMLPALYMQLACMYEPVHILTFHILPGLAMVLVGAALAILWRRRHSAS